MNKNQHLVRYALGLILLMVCCMECAYGQPPAGTTPPAQPGERQRPLQSADKYDRGAVQQAIEQPLNSVLVRIRFKKEYGYKSESARGGEPGLASCDVFSVALAKPARPAVPNVLIPVRRPEQISDRLGYYFCEFLITGLALDQEVTVGASVEDQEPWLGGTAPLPANYQRVLTDRERTATLTQSDPRATMNFEVMYEPRGQFVQPRRSSDSMIRKP